MAIGAVAAIGIFSIGVSQFRDSILQNQQQINELTFQVMNNLRKILMHYSSNSAISFFDIINVILEHSRYFNSEVIRCVFNGVSDDFTDNSRISGEK